MFFYPSNVFLDQRPERILGKRVRHGNGVGVASVRPDGQAVCAVVALEGHGVAGDFQRFLLGVYSIITGIVLRSGGFAVAQAVGIAEILDFRQAAYSGSF